MKRIAQVLCLVVAIAGLPRASWASGEKATPAEDAKYAELEAASPEAASFEGGDAAGVLLFILIVAAIAVLIYYMMDHGHHAMKSPIDAPEAPAPPPAVFR
ncbi:MAG TPA: hypothetical protein VFS19_05535 [Planctomycetota bacterium]|nr:hypothetical protein [Planctomycetota bacterium]